jgi:hypothetical protein
MKQAPSKVESCKKTKLWVVACDVKLEVIFCGICVHGLRFLACCEVLSLVAFYVVWLFLYWSFDGGLSSNGARWK